MARSSDTSHSTRPVSDRGQTIDQNLAPNDARQSQVVLKGPRQRLIFVAGITGAIIVAAIIAWFMV